jgi:hypothetical protein
VGSVQHSNGFERRPGVNLKIANPAVNFVNTLQRGGAATTRFRLTAEEVQKLKAAEKLGHDEAVKTLLGFLRTPRS